MTINFILILRIIFISQDDQFLTTYNGLRALEKETTAKITSVVGTRRQKDDKKEVDKKAVVFPVGYVKRGDRYRHTLDTGKFTLF